MITVTSLQSDKSGKTPYRHPFLETGRAQPSRDMLLHLAEQLDVPCASATYCWQRRATRRSSASAPSRDPALAAARTAIDLVLAGHEPFPAIAVDRHWRLVSANNAVGLLLAGVDQDLLRQPVKCAARGVTPQWIGAAHRQSR